MKAIILFISAIVLLSSCSVFRENCAYNKYSLSGKCKPKKCSTCIHEVCDAICDTCHVNETSCAKCWKCVDYQGCGSDVNQSM